MYLFKAIILINSMCFQHELSRVSYAFYFVHQYDFLPLIHGLLIWYHKSLVIDEDQYELDSFTNEDYLLDCDGNFNNAKDNIMS